MTNVAGKIEYVMLGMGAKWYKGVVIGVGVI